MEPQASKSISKTEDHQNFDNTLCISCILNMELVEITQRPSISSFTPLSQHQEETPSTFFGGLAVLHAYAPEAKLLIQQRQYDETPSVQKLGAVEAVAAGYAEISELEVWVTSRYSLPKVPASSSEIELSKSLNFRTSPSLQVFHVLKTS